MAITVYAADVAKTALAQVGKSCGKTNEYSAELDKVNFYNGKKNGVANSCSIFVDDMVYRNTSPKTAHNARSVLYEPDVDNCGAGCAQAVGYFKAHKAWIDNPKNFKVGDKYFLKQDSKKSKINPLGVYHTGVVVAVNGDEFTGVEGNTNGGKVADKKYKVTDKKLAGAGRPKYTEGPAPEPTPTKDQYTVVTKTGDTLKIRKEPNTSSEYVGEIPNGTTVTASDVVKGQDIQGCDAWIATTYNGATGYSSGKYLTPTPVVPEPQPHPEPPTPQPVTTAYKVKTITGAPLALRVAPKQGSQCIVWMPNGSSVTVDKTVTGEMVYGSKTWAHATYKGMTGYCTLTRLKKV